MEKVYGRRILKYIAALLTLLQNLLSLSNKKLQYCFTHLSTKLYCMNKKPGRFPSGIFYIMGNEMAERFSYYGMTAILTTFLVRQFFNPTGNASLSTVANAKSNHLVHLFFSLVYFLPIFGGIIADWFWGKYKTILYLSLVYCLGHFLLFLFPSNINGFAAGLFCIAIGAGGIKPCVSAIVGDQFDESRKQLISKAFGLFFFCINTGAFLSQLTIPYISGKWGYSWAFAVPGFLMGIATIIFFIGRNKYKQLPPSGVKKENFLAINFYALTHRRLKKPGESFLDTAKNKYSEPGVTGVKAVWKILVFFSLVPFFYTLYYQSNSEWILQATQLDLHFLGINWLAEQVQSSNGITILFFIPFFTYILFPFLERKGIKITPLDKFGAGFIASIFSLCIIYWLQLQIDKGGHPNVGWQFCSYTLLTIGEVLIYQTGLEYAYTQAPESMKSTIMAFLFLCLSIGNFILSMISGSIASGGLFSFLTGASYYLFFVVVMIAATLVYYFIIKRYLSKG
jgi:proton-dependent oligopeptide transporter, POT family